AHGPDLVHEATGLAHEVVDGGGQRAPHRRAAALRGFFERGGPARAPLGLLAPALETMECLHLPPEAGRGGGRADLGGQPVRDLPERLGVAEAVGDARMAAASIFAEQPLYDPGVVRVGLEAADVQRGGLARPTLESLEVGFVLEVEDVDGLDEALAGPGPVPGEGGFEGVLAGEGSFEAAGIDEANGLELRER